jgi:anti-anti-sigma factor
MNTEHETRRIELHGDYDLQRQAEVRSLFNEIADEAEIELDLHDVPYVDSSFLNELVVLRNRLPHSKISLLRASPQLKHIFDIVGFEGIFNIPTSD